jgi:hypothetical protein
VDAEWNVGFVFNLRGNRKMKTTWQVVLAVATALAFSAFAKTNAPGAFVFKGTVVDGAGSPLEGATVEGITFSSIARFGSSDPTVTERTVAGAGGMFELTLPRTGAYVLARKPGFAPAWRQFWNVQGDTEQRLVLTPPSFLAGTVVDEADKPVAGAEVFAFMAFSSTQEEGGRQTYNYLSGKLARDLFSARTGADGRFRIEGFPTNASANLSVKAVGKALHEPSLPSSFGPDTMQCQPGQSDIRLVLEPAGSVEGKIVAEDGATPVPIAQLFLQPDGPGSFGAGMQEPQHSSADGTFRIPDVAAGNYRVRAMFGTNTPQDWVAETVSVSVEAGQATRDVQIAAVRGGLLGVAVLGKTDRKPRAQVSVNAYRQNYQTGASSDSNGLAVLRLPPGEYQINAYVPGARQESSAATVEANKTNRLEIEMADPARIAGVVRGPDGQPAAGLEVRIIGGYSPGGGSVKTDAAGKFVMEWNPQQFGGPERSYCVLVRDAARNLAVAQDIDEETGPLDLRLAPALTIAGRAECDGKPLTNATAALVFWTGNSGMHLQGLVVGTNTPGRFEIPALPPGRRYGLSVSAPGYGQHFVNTVDSDEAKRVEVDPVELKPANLKLAGQVLDAEDKPVSGVYVNLNGENQPNGNARTDREGRFRFDHVCEGTVRLFANARNTFGNVAAEGGDTNVVIRLGEQSAMSGGVSRKLKGVVTGPDGKPAAGVQVAVFPFNNSRWVKTGADGAFSLNWSVQTWQLESGGDPWLVVRDLAHDLAAAETISEGVTNLNAQLKPALTIRGRVEGADGAPLTNAQVEVWLTACRMSSQLSDKPASTDARGGFEIKTMPAGPKYNVYAKAKDHGKKRVELEAEADTNLVTLPPFVLKVADQVVAGQVIGPNDKPVSGVHVSLSGEDQPGGFVTTDSKGRFTFKVCEGEIRLFANSQDSFADATVTPGDTNVVLQLTRSGSSRSEAPKRASLTGKPLPDLASVGLAADAAPADKPLLLCLLDAEQRPSRRAARLLAEQRDALTQKGVALLAVQVVAASGESFREWTNASPLPFPVGFIAKKAGTNKWATSVPSLPWLILRNAQGTVVAEGFALDELDAKLGALKK